MRLPIIIRNIGLALLFNSIFLFISFLISLYNNDNAALPLLYGTMISFLFGIFPIIYVPQSNYINTLEGIVIVVFGWLATCLIGAIPYILWGGEFSFINAWFESVSGYTTTGSTILNDIEQLPSGLIFWRSSTHWIGGMGIIIFTLLILPESSKTRMILLNTEMSVIAKNNFRHRTKEVIRILAVVYIGLTLIESIILQLFGMSLYDAVNHSFATIATGGFSTRNLSIAYYNNIYIEITIMIFMIASGIHFGLIFSTITGGKNNILKSSVVKYYLLFMLAGIIGVTAKLYLTGYGTWLHSLRYASFQVISLGTTTGFATTDSASWPFFTQMILIYFTIQCACVGSTSGGLKFDRVFIFFKSIGKQIRLLQHPMAVIQVKIDKKTIPESLENQTLVFILLYLLVILISTLLLSALGIDLLTAFSGTAATIGNVGPGLANVSSMGNFSDIPSLGKLIFTFDMLLGRLEIYGLISLFFVRSWK